MTKSRGLIKRVPWTAAEEQVVRDRYADEQAATIARDLGRAVHTIHSRAHKLGLAKSETFNASPLSGRLSAQSQTAASLATRFKKGNVPWTSGTKGVAGTHENSRRTQFKAGETPIETRHNYVPIGTEKVTADGYLVRKMNDDRRLVPARRWEFVHRLVWINAHGPIPSGHAVVFRPGRKTSDADKITVDALELVSRNELMRRNSYHTNYPKEVAQLIQLKGALTRKINRRSQA